MKNYILLNPLLVEQQVGLDFLDDITGTPREKEEPEEKEEEEEEPVTGYPSPVEMDPMEPETWFPFLKKAGIEITDEFQDWLTDPNRAEAELKSYYEIALNAVDDVSRDLSQISFDAAEKLDKYIKQLEKTPEELDKFINRYGLDAYATPKGVGIYDEFQGEIEKMLSKNPDLLRREAYAEYAYEALERLGLQIVDILAGMDPAELIRAYEYTMNGEFEKAWDEIKPNFNVVLDEMTLYATQYLEGKGGDDPETTEVSDLTRQGVKLFQAAVVLYIVRLSAKISSRRIALQKLVKLAGAAKFSDEQLVAAAERNKGQLKGFFQSEKSYLEAVKAAAAREGYNKGVWGADPRNRIVKFLDATKDQVGKTLERGTRSVGGGPLFYDSIRLYYDGKYQEQLAKATIGDFIEDTKGLIGKQEFDNVEDALKKLDEIAGEYGSKAEQLQLYNDDPNRQKLEAMAGEKNPEALAVKQADKNKGRARSSKIAAALTNWNNSLPASERLGASALSDLAKGIDIHDFPTEGDKALKKKYEKAKAISDNANNLKAEVNNKVTTYAANAAKSAFEQTKLFIRTNLELILYGYDAAIFQGMDLLNDLDSWATDFGTQKPEGSGLRKTIDKLKRTPGLRSPTAKLALDSLEDDIRKTIRFSLEGAQAFGANTMTARTFLRNKIQRLIKVLKEELSNKNTNKEIADGLDLILKDMDLKANEEVAKINKDIENIEKEVINKINLAVEKARKLSSKKLKGDLESLFGQDLSKAFTATDAPEPFQTPVDESKIRITKSKLIDLISEQVKEQTQTIDVTKDQLVALVTQEAFKQINRKK